MKINLMHERDQALTGGSSGAVSKKKELSQEDKKAQRAKELLKELQIVRGLPFTLTVKARFNLPEEVEVVKKEPEVVVDPKKKK
jgi:hypothetical protein